MSTDLTKAENKLERRKQLAVVASEIDAVASEAMTMFESAGNFTEELGVAQAVVDMRALLTDDIMKPIMALMNTDLGFRTDKDPKLSRDPVTPYSVEVVRECFIESKLRGFHTVGNEWNIIAGRFYGCKNGLARKVKEVTKGTFEPSYDPPILAPDGKSARVKCRGAWMINGQHGDIGVKAADPCEFVIRVNAFMGADAIIGKAERKLNKRVFERLTGRIIPEGEVDDSIPVASTVTQSAPTAGPTFSGPAPEPVAKEEKPENVTDLPKAPPTAAENPTEPTPQTALAAFVASVNSTYDVFQGWLVSAGHLTDAEKYPGFSDLPTAFATKMAADTRSLARFVRLYGSEGVVDTQK
ncbi:MAG: hypothetical protein JWM68_3769 [Verrucomicrobiales bacterium]|nr:hypothetical protein [Verrucomicrobiales bacterium]